MNVKTKDPNLDEENYNICDKSRFSCKVGSLKWYTILNQLLLMFVVYAPNEILLLFCLISMGIGYVTFDYWPRMCLCDESEAE